MLRTAFVAILIGIGVYYSLQAPFYALLFYLANAYFRPEQWLWINFIPSYFSFVIGAYLVLSSLFSGQHFFLNKKIVLIFAFVLHSFLSIFFSDYFAVGWGAWVNFLKSIVITYFIIVLTKDFSQFRLVLLILALFLGVEGAKQGWVYLALTPSWGANPNKIPFLGDNNGVAVGMLMLVPIFAFLAQTTQRRWVRFGFWFLLVGVLFRALSTYSRGGFLACLALGGTYWLRSRQKLRVLLGIAVIVAIVFPSLSEHYWERMETIKNYEEENEGSALGRLHFWAVAVAMANAHPWLGIGPNCYNTAYNAYDFLDGKYGQNRSVHSSFFGVLGELGYVGAALYGLINLCALHSCRRVRKLAAKHPTLLALSQSATALETSLVVFIVGGSFLPFQYNEMFWHFIGFTVALEEIATRSAFASESAADTLPDTTVREATVTTVDERA